MTAIHSSTRGRTGRDRLLASALAIGLSLATGLTMTRPALAQAPDYPNKPIRFVVSSAAGGVVDIRARRFGLRLGELLKQPIVVDNRPGASTTIGAEFVARSAPDGYTALFGGNTETDQAKRNGKPVDNVDQHPVTELLLGGFGRIIARRTGSDYRDVPHGFPRTLSLESGC